MSRNRFLIGVVVVLLAGLVVALLVREGDSPKPFAPRSGPPVAGVVRDKRHTPARVEVGVGLDVESGLPVPVPHPYNGSWELLLELPSGPQWIGVSRGEYEGTEVGRVFRR